MLGASCNEYDDYRDCTNEDLRSKRNQNRHVASEESGGSPFEHSPIPSGSWLSGR
jgi:hypothetical protein